MAPGNELSCGLTKAPYPIHQQAAGLCHEADAGAGHSLLWNHSMVNLRKAVQQGKQPAAGAGTLSEELQSSSQADDAAHMVAQVLFLSHGKSFLTHTSSGRSFWSRITGWVHDQCQACQSAGHQHVRLVPQVQCASACFIAP